MEAAPPARESAHPAVVHAHISHAVVATYAADAALGVPGVHALASGVLGALDRRGDRGLRGPRVTASAEGDGHVDLELRLVLEPDASAPAVARSVNRAVRDFLLATAAVETGQVRVVVEAVAGDGPGGE